MIIEILRNASHYTVQEIILLLIVMLFALTVSFSFHEFMHAFVADWLGDDTPRLYGRVTMNPKAHLDPMGTAMLLLVGFGWGKPVMYNPSKLRRFKSRRLMNIMVTLAGVTGNLIVALISMCIISLILVFTGNASTFPLYESTLLVSMGLNRTGDFPFYAAVFIYLFYYTFMFSMSLFAFNLLPIPPLDGFNFWRHLLPVKITYSEGFKKFAQYGPMVLMGLVIIGSFSNYDILSTVMGWLEYPAMFLISFIAGLFGHLG